MIDPEEIGARLQQVKQLLQAMDAADEPDVEGAAEVARLMQTLAHDLKQAVLSAGANVGAPAADQQTAEPPARPELPHD